MNETTGISPNLKKFHGATVPQCIGTGFRLKYYRNDKILGNDEQGTTQFENFRLKGATTFSA